MTHWVRFEHKGEQGFGKLENDSIAIFQGDMFDSPQDNGKQLASSEVNLLPPCEPGKILALWNNSRALAEKLELQSPTEPLYFVKCSNSLLAPGATIQRPAHYDGRIVFEAEIAIVIGKTCSGVSAEQAPDYIFGYTCINDVTAFDLLNKDPQFQQWTRCKSFDTFGPLGPAIATDLDLDTLAIRSIVNDGERQNYPIADLFFAPHELVSLISLDVTLNPGDVIACGTSAGAGSLKPGAEVEIYIDGIGSLKNTMQA